MDTIFDRRGAGKCAVLDFLDTLEADELGAVFDSINKIKEFGIDTPRKFLENLGNGLFAIRAREDRVRVRIMAFIYGGYLIGTHGFKKKVGPIPEGDKRKAAKVKSEYEKNDDGKKILKELLGG